MSNKTEPVNLFHYGVYGIVLKNASILLIRKSRGPYIGKLDLPGGKPEEGETPQETLAREMLEETGIVVHASNLLDTYRTVFDYNLQGVIHRFHHTGLIYMITEYDDASFKRETQFEDSLGADFYFITALTEDMLTPFAYRVLQAM